MAACADAFAAARHASPPASRSETPPPSEAPTCPNIRAVRLNDQKERLKRGARAGVPVRWHGYMPRRA
eukprot:6199363-Pleurochrysis_carterae.AAC.5